MLQRKLSTVLLAKYAYITGGSKHPAKTMSLASNEHIDNQCCNTWCNGCNAAVVVAAATVVPGGLGAASVCSGAQPWKVESRTLSEGAAGTGLHWRR